jgi:hypothetical protein
MAASPLMAQRPGAQLEFRSTLGGLGAHSSHPAVIVLRARRGQSGASNPKTVSSVWFWDMNHKAISYSMEALCWASRGSLLMSLGFYQSPGDNEL